MITTLIHTDTRYPVNRKIIRKAVEDTLNKFKATNISAEVSVAVVGSRKMKVLTDKYLKDEKRHEILTFPFEEVTQKTKAGFINPPDNVLRLGDIILCWPQVLEEASHDDIMVDNEVYNLTCHGVEHLLSEHHD